MIKVGLVFSRFPTFLLKFTYSEKATKFFEISTVDLTSTTQKKFKMEISQNFVAFSKYMNFNKKSQGKKLSKKKMRLFSFKIADFSSLLNGRNQIIEFLLKNPKKNHEKKEFSTQFLAYPMEWTLLNLNRRYSNDQKVLLKSIKNYLEALQQQL